MYHIRDFNKSYYSVEFLHTLESSEYTQQIQLFKSIGINFDSSSKKWIFQKKKLFEVELWFGKWNHEYKSDAPPHQFPPRETQFFRSEVFDPSTIKATLFSYQQDLIEWAVKRSRIFIADEPGLGKTLQSIAWVSHLYSKKKIDSVLVLVKNALAYHWKKEFLTFSPYFTEDDIEIINNDNKQKPFSKDKKIYIIKNHLFADVAYSYSGKPNTRKKSSLRWDKPYFDLLKEWGKSSPALIIDEAHEFKNSKALRSKSLRPYLSGFEYRALLSATPAINRFEDWWNQIQILDKSLIPVEEDAFKVMIADKIGDKFDPYAITQYNSQAVQSIKNAFQLNIIKRLKKDLPEFKTKRIIKPIFFEMSTLHKKLYTDLVNRELHRVSMYMKPKDIENKFPYLIQCIDNPFLLRDKLAEKHDKADWLDDNIEKQLSKWDLKHDTKVNYLDEYLQDSIEELDEKVVVFDSHPVTLDCLYSRYMKYDPIVIHGGTNDNDFAREEKISKFNDPKSSCKLAILQVLSLSAGINLNKGSRRIVFFTLPNDATAYRQGLDRTDRITSLQDSLIEILVYDKTYDFYRYKRTINRTEFNDSFLNTEMSVERISQILNGAF